MQGIKEKNFLFETRTKISAAKGGGTIYVYSKNCILKKSFIFAKEAAKFFNYSSVTISNYIKNSKLFQNQWTLSLKDTSVSYQ